MVAATGVVGNDAGFLILGETGVEAGELRGALDDLKVGEHGRGRWPFVRRSLPAETRLC